MKEFQKIGVKKRSKVLDWLKYAEIAVNGVRQDGYVVPAPGFHETGDLIPDGKTCEKIYRAGGSLYAFLSDGKLFKESETVMTAISDTVFTAPPLLAEVYNDGKKRILAVSVSGGTLIGTATDPEENVSVPCGEKIAVFNGMLFSASKNEITVSKLFFFYRLFGRNGRKSRDKVARGRWRGKTAFRAFRRIVRPVREIAF